MLATQDVSVPESVLRPFKRNFLDHQDPFDTAGRLMPDFTFSGNYELFDATPTTVVKQIWTHLHRRTAELPPGISTTQIAFKDVKISDEDPRSFVVIHTDTRRGTLISINAFFRPYGNHLYFSVRSYILPPLSILKLVLWTLFSLMLLANAARVGWMAEMLGFGFLRPVAFLLVLGILALLFRKFIRCVRAGDSIYLALRKQFPKRFDRGTFNNDDVSAFLRTNVSLMMRSVADVLKQHGIDISGLMQIIQNIEVNNINTGGGSIWGSIIGGQGNRASTR